MLIYLSIVILLTNQNSICIPILVALAFIAISTIIVAPITQIATATTIPCNPDTVCGKEHRDIENYLNATSSALQKGDIKGALSNLDQAKILLQKHDANEQTNSSAMVTTQKDLKSNATPTGTLNVIVNIDCTLPPSGCYAPANFTISVSGNNPSPSSFKGSSFPGTQVVLDPGQYSVSANWELSSHCSGTINAGDNKNCNIDIIVNPSSR